MFSKSGLRISLCAVFISLMAAGAFGQAVREAPSASVRLTGGEVESMGLHEARLIDLDVGSVQSGRPFSMTVPLDGEEHFLDLRPRSLRGPDFRVEVHEGRGLVREVPPPPPMTFQGTVRGQPGSTAAVSFVDGRLHAMILARPADSELWFVQPLERDGVEQAGYVVYNNYDVIADSRWTDIDLPNPNRPQDLDEREPAAGESPMVFAPPPGWHYETEIACDAAGSAHLLLTEIGQVAYPGFAAPMWRVAYRPFQAQLKQVLVLAGIHGNETAGVACVLSLIRRLQAARASTARCDMDILPMINPWGWVHDLPYTHGRIDLADDFTRFDSPEARIIRRFLRGKRYDLVLELREDPRASGFYLRRYALEDAGGSSRTVDRIRAAGYPIESNPGGLLLKPKDGIVDVPFWSLALLRSTRQLTVGGYLRQKAGGGVLSVVTPAPLPLADRIAMQQMAVEGLLTECAEPKNQPEPYPN